MAKSEPCDCGTPFQIHTLDNPRCSVSNGTYKKASYATVPNSAESTKPVKLKLSSDFEALVQAQNRTTHAVRAFVRFLFIQLTAITLAAFLWNLSIQNIDTAKCYANGENCSANTFLQIAAIVVWFIGVIWSSNAGWSELEKSNIEEN